jgi:hypothetical protein
LVSILTGTGNIRLEATPAAGPPPDGLWSAWKLAAQVQLGVLGVPVVQDGFAIGKARGNAKFDVHAGPENTSVTVALRDSKIQLVNAKMPLPASIPTNPAVRILDWAESPPSDSALEGSGNLRLDVSLPTPLMVEGSGSAIGLSGRMVLDRRGTLARVEGGLRLIPGGVFHLFDNPFVIRTGIITFRETSPRQGTTAESENRALSPCTTMRRFMRGRWTSSSMEDHSRHPVATELRGPLRQVPPHPSSAPEYQILTLLITGRVDTVVNKKYEGKSRDW